MQFFVKFPRAKSTATHFQLFQYQWEIYHVAVRLIATKTSLTESGETLRSRWNINSPTWNDYLENAHIASYLWFNLSLWECWSHRNDKTNVQENFLFKTQLPIKTSSAPRDPWKAVPKNQLWASCTHFSPLCYLQLPTNRSSTGLNFKWHESRRGRVSPQPSWKKGKHDFYDQRPGGESFYTTDRVKQMKISFMISLLQWI